MTGYTGNGRGQVRHRWRIAGWSAAALLLLLPLAAMQVTDEVDWGVADFAVLGVLLAGAGTALELTVRRTGDVAYRAAVGLALAGAFILVILAAGVGIIGRDGDPANLMFAGVLAVGGAGALAARFRPGGMARAMVAMASAQALAALIALVAGWGRPWSGPGEILGLNAFFVALFAASAGLFRRADRETASIPTGGGE